MELDIKQTELNVLTTSKERRNSDGTDYMKALTTSIYIRGSI